MIGSGEPKEKWNGRKQGMINFIYQVAVWETSQVNPPGNTGVENVLLKVLNKCYFFILSLTFECSWYTRWHMKINWIQFIIPAMLLIVLVRKLMFYTFIRMFSIWVYDHFIFPFENGIKSLYTLSHPLHFLSCPLKHFQLIALD